MNDGPFGGITFIKHDSEKHTPKLDDTPMLLVDGQLDGAVAGLLGDLDHAGQAGEPAANLGQHEVSADEGQFGVAGSDIALPGPSGR
jgi:hypothetical protein